MKQLILLTLLSLTAHAGWFDREKPLTIKHDSHDRQYLIHVPKSYTGNSAVPLLLVFHGGGGNMNIQANDKFYKQISASEQNGHIAVFPNGDRKRLATWNAGKCCGNARDNNMDDVGFVRKLIEEVRAKYKIDSSKIFATGMSNGAMMSYRLACELSDVISGIAAVAGTDNTITCSPTRPVSILHIHAKDDDHVQFNGGAGPSSAKKSAVTDYVSVPKTIEKWTKLDGCTGSAKKVLEVAGAYCEEYAECKSGSRVKLCVTDTGKHSWPGGKKILGEEGSKAILANDVMWDFFKTTSASGR